MKSVKFILAILSLLLLPVHPVLGSWSSTPDATISRTLEKTLADVDEPITVTVTFTNSHTSSALRGFYYSEQIPQGVTVSTVSVKLDGIDVSNYTYEVGLSDAVYPSYTPHRWILETPPDFTEDNPVPFGDSTLEIVYTVSSSARGSHYFEHFNWVGYYEGDQDPAFGHSEGGDEVTLVFSTKDGVAVNFAAYSLYHYENGSWNKIHDGKPENMLGVGMDLYADFGGVSTGGQGLYKYDGIWTRLTPADAQDMVDVGSDLYVDFGGVSTGGQGLYKYDGTWTRLSNVDAEDMVGVGGDLYVDFGGASTGGYGLYKYDGTWTMLTPADADGMCAVDLE
jgi:uncharacterized repeat protein (TIGR01451 family)